MKKISLGNYRTDKFYPRIVRAVEAILARGDVVVPVEVFVEMHLLSAESLEEWRRGRVPYLERVIRCNLSEASRILRILGMHVHDLSLRPSMTVYMRHGKGPKSRLRFSKWSDPKVEEAYGRHFIRVRSKRPLREAGPSPEMAHLDDDPISCTSDNCDEDQAGTDSAGEEGQTRPSGVSGGHGGLLRT
jgi:hypothetical protein